MSDLDTDDPEAPSAVVEPSKPRLLAVLGPGLITGASDDDPSGIATYSQVGARFGYGLSWTLLLTFPLMVAVQMISARIGRTTGHGIAGVLRAHYPAGVLHAIVAVLLVANVINIGADLGAMADAVSMVVPKTLAVHWAWVIGFAVVCAAMQIFLRYTRYVSILKWLTLSLFSYFAVVLTAGVDWGALGRAMVMPTFESSSDYLTAVVAIFGTTISPYLFFWQSSQEVEDIDVHPRRTELIDAPEQGKAALQRIEIDTVVGMGISNAVALAILVTAAATLHAKGITDIESSAQAAEALRPIAGDFAFALFTIGIVGTGFLAVPVLAGSAAYAVGEARRWPVGFSRRWQEAKAFYGTVAIATLIGMGLNFSGVNPIDALYWSAVLNGVVAVPVMVLMMLIGARRDIMGEFTLRGSLRGLGWAATLAMAAAVVGMAITL